MIKKIISTTVVLSVVAMMGYASYEPSMVEAQASDSVQVSLTVSEEISITSPADVTMTGMSLTVDESTGAATWNVKTNSENGYGLTVNASTDPAMQGSSSNFADYTEASPGTPETWSVSNAYEFGFSGFGDHVTDGTWGAGSSCGAGTVPSNLNYQGFDGTSPISIATSASETTASGTDTTICFAAEQETVEAPNDTYTATVTATATAN